MTKLERLNLVKCVATVLRPLREPIRKVLIIHNRRQIKKHLDIKQAKV